MSPDFGILHWRYDPPLGSIVSKRNGDPDHRLEAWTVCCGLHYECAGVPAAPSSMGIYKYVLWYYMPYTVLFEGLAYSRNGLNKILIKVDFRIWIAFIFSVFKYQS